MANLDLKEIASAMEDHARDLYDWYLNLQTGEVLPLPEEALQSAEEGKELEALPEWERKLYKKAEEILSSPPDGPWVRIPTLPSWEVYDEMVAFAESVEDEQLRALLEVALQGKGAFRRFKDVLARYPEERKRWFAKKDAFLLTQVASWLESLGVKHEEWGT
jgi:hypothetical protein